MFWHCQHVRNAKMTRTKWIFNQHRLWCKSFLLVSLDHSSLCPMKLFSLLFNLPVVQKRSTAICELSGPLYTVYWGQYGRSGGLRSERSSRWTRYKIQLKVVRQRALLNQTLSNTLFSMIDRQICNSQSFCEAEEIKTVRFFNTCNQRKTQIQN